MRVFVAGSWRTISRATVCLGGSWRRITRGSAYYSGGWRNAVTLAPPFTVSAPATAMSYFTRPTAATITTNDVTATPSGGVAPYSYNWSIVSGDAMNISSPSQATTRFSAYMSPGTTKSATAQVACTDAQGRTAYANVAVTLTLDYLDTGGF